MYVYIYIYIYFVFFNFEAKTVMSIELLARFQDFATSFKDREVFGYLLGSSYPNLRCLFANIYMSANIKNNYISMRAVYLYEYIRTSI